MTRNWYERNYDGDEEATIEAQFISLLIARGVDPLSWRMDAETLKAWRQDPEFHKLVNVQRQMLQKFRRAI